VDSPAAGPRSLSRARRIEGDVGDPDVERDVAHEHHHLHVLAHVGLVGGQVLPELRCLVADVLEDAVDPAVGGDELGRCLLPDTRHAGQVV